MKKRMLSRTNLSRSTAGLFFGGILVLSSAQWGKAHTAYFRWHQDKDYYYIESNGMPTHKMMVGITAWQQQVPIPQDYTGDNAWRIPRHPIMSDKPVNVRSALFSGAIAVAVNGVPIFNPIKNDGKTDTFVAGELDDFGGHCGRADDYHYHMPPLFLVDVVGRENPIAYALDGFPIYGLNEPDGSAPVGLDDLNGHKDAQGNYHYHSTKAFPYLNGGERGVVKVERDAIVPQPFTAAIRHWLMPKRGAKIVGFTWPGPNQYSLDYTIGNQHGFVNYAINDKGGYTFNFIEPNGTKTTETYDAVKTRLSSYLTVNNGGSATVSPGESVLYAWGSTSATNATATIQIFKGTNIENPTTPVPSDGCGTSSGPADSITGKFGAAHIATKACQSGFTYKYTFTATDGDKKVSDEAVVAVR